MSRRKDRKTESRDLMACAEGRKDWLDKYDLLYWGFDPIVTIIFIIIAIIVPVPVAFFFGDLPFFITAPIAWTLAAIGTYILAMRIKREVEERE